MNERLEVNDYRYVLFALAYVSSFLTASLGELMVMDVVLSGLINLFLICGMSLYNVRVIYMVSQHDSVRRKFRRVLVNVMVVCATTTMVLSSVAKAMVVSDHRWFFFSVFTNTTALITLMVSIFLLHRRYHY